MNAEVIDPAAPSRHGMPRPLALHDKQDKLLPVPWSQGNGWGMLNDDRHTAAIADSLCLLCGHDVAEGVVFVRVKHKADSSPYATTEPAEQYTRKSLGSLFIVDGAPLHKQCAVMTAAHCPTIKDMVASGYVAVVPYVDDEASA
jgi:hypothetical protein